jgi:putative ABC transport system substrate-binding protein
VIQFSILEFGFSIERKKIFCVTLCTMLLAFCASTQAQQPGKVPRIGFLGAAPASVLASRLEGLRQGLRELGYEEGKNLAIEYRYSEGKFDRLPVLAAELMDSNVALVVTHGEAAIHALKQTGRNIPIVVGVTGDLVVTGHAASLAHPGGNVTGFVDTSPDLSGKRLELIKEVQPKTSRIAILWNAGNPVKELDFKETETAARALGLKLESLKLKTPQDLDSAFKAAQGSGGLVVLQDALTIGNARRIVQLAKSRPPARDVRFHRICRRRRFDVLRGEFPGPVSPSRNLRRQDFERREARRSSRRAADQI